MSFIHLRVHSEYSLVDGTIRTSDLVAWAADQDMGAIGISDQDNLFGLIKFYKAALAVGVKPIMGCDLKLSGGPDEDSSRITLLVRSAAGYRHLCELVSAAQLNNGNLAAEQIADKSAGLICLVGGLDSQPGQLLLAGKVDAASQSIQQWMAIFPGCLYLEVTRCGRRGEEELVQRLVKVADALDCPLVATNDVRFVGKDDFLIHEARVCIHEGRVLEDPRRERRYSEEQFLKPVALMEALFPDLPDALQNTVEIAKRCSLPLELGQVYLPEYPTPDGSTTDAYLSRVAREGLEKRLPSILASAAEDLVECRNRYQDRLEHELGVINQMGYSGYYLIVMEFIQWARQQGIPVGPGRGSGAASLVAYALQITDIDPLPYDLVFERFLNPDRVSMPDFDIDFCMERRDEVIQHVVDLYGKEAVSQIVTFGTLGARAVVRDVARVQGKPYSLGDKLSRMIPFDPRMTLGRACEEESELSELVKEDEEVAEIWEMATRLEGLPRNIGKHAGGVVIAPTRLTDFSAVCSDDAGGLMTQFDKDDIEQAGLVKFDFLGLRTLTVIDWAVGNIHRRLPESGIDITRIPLDDLKVYRLLQRGETAAVFQLESPGMTDLIKRLRPDSFDDISSLVALYRPGPMKMADDFARRKHNPAEISYLHPQLEPVLHNTYGVILYQEQVMQIAQVLAGYTLAQADLLRLAMSKKKVEEMARHRRVFCAGATVRGVEERLAEEIFDLMESFAHYGFNKSHSVAYAKVAYQTAWLKTHYPADFMAASLSSDADNTDKVVNHIEVCRKMGIKLLAPDINQSHYRFIADQQQAIIYGLSAVRGLGTGMVEAIVEARGDKSFKDLFDFCQRVESRRIRKKAMEVLIDCGAMDSLVGPEVDAACIQQEDLTNWKRSLLHSNLDEAVGLSELNARNADTGSQDLFGELTVIAGPERYRIPRDMHIMDHRACLEAEHESLGFYLSGHPFTLHQAVIRKLAPTELAKLTGSSEARYVAGLIVGQRTIRSKRGDPMSFVTLDDRSDCLEVLVPRELHASCQEKLRDDQVVAMRVTATQKGSGRLMVNASEVLTLPEVRMRSTRCLLLKVAAEKMKPDFCRGLRRLLSPYRREDGCRVSIHYLRADAEGRLWLGDAWRVELHDDLLSQLGASYGPDQVTLEAN